MDINKPVYDYAVRLLSKRDYSRYKLGQKLLQHKYQLEDIEPVIQKLIEQNYLREEEYARIRVKTLMLNGHGNKTIKARLEAEELFVEDEFIDKLRAENQMESPNVVDALIQKKLRGKVVPADFEERLKLNNKLINFLISKGHDYYEVKDKVSKVLNERVDP